MLSRSLHAASSGGELGLHGPIAVVPVIVMSLVVLYLRLGK
jgi:hypothetical protein